MLVQFFVLFAVVVALLRLWIWRQYRHWEHQDVPHIKPTFPTGTLKLPGSQLGLTRLNQLYYNRLKGRGFFGGIYVFLSPAVLVTDPEFVRRVLVRDFSFFHDRDIYYNERDDPLSAHLFNIGGEKWQKLRNKLSPTFTSGRLKHMFSVMAAIGERFVEVLGQQPSLEGLEMKELLARFTTDMIGTCAFGLETNSLRDPDAEFRVMGRNILAFPRHSRLFQLLFMTWKPLARFLRVKTFRDDEAEFFLNTVKSTVEYREWKGVVRNDFMDLLLKLKKTGEITFHELAAQCLIFFLAGFETSSTAMSYALYELALSPEIQERARTSVNEALRKHDGQFTYESVNEMTYLDCCIQESLRKYPPVPNLVRSTSKDYPVPEMRTTIKKGTLVMVPCFAIMRDPEFFPDPDEFRPERFAPDQASKRVPYTFLPFGDGPRNCIGMRFGLLQARIGLALLLKHFELSLHEKTEVPLQFDDGRFLLAVKGGIYVNLKRL